MEAELERNMKEIKMDTSFQSPVQKKDISTLKNSGYNESNYQVDKISDSKEQVDTSIRPNTDYVEQVYPIRNTRVDTHITDVIKKLPIRPITFEPVAIGQDLVTSVQETLIEGLSQESLKQLHTISSKDIVTDAACNSAQVDRIFRTSSRAINMTPRVNIEIFSPIRGSNYSFEKWLRNIDPLNTSVDVYAAQESNSTCFCIEKLV